MNGRSLFAARTESVLSYVINVEGSGEGSMRTRDLDEAIDAVTKVYCPHTVQIIGSSRDVDVVLNVTRLTSQPLVELSYDVPVAIDAGSFPRLFLMMRCDRGAASTVQEDQSTEWRRGQTVPFSAGFDTQLRFDGAFVQKAVRLDVDKLETLCARWIGHPLDRPLRFSLCPFSDDLERIWRRTLAYLWSSEEGGLPLAGAARTAFDEFLLTLLLQHHPHNYSEEMSATVRVPASGLVRSAERFMADNAGESITVSDVAAHLGVSLRSLQAGFRQWRNTTPNAFLRHIRLHRVRDALLRAGAEANVTSVALSHGFSHLGRFSAHYQSAFGEAPSATLRRSRSMPIKPRLASARPAR
jgi:AraC-like DNA-binding protein